MTKAALIGPDVELRLAKTVIGRMLMNAEGTARAANQVAEIAIDVPSGALTPPPRGIPRTKQKKENLPASKMK